MLENAIRFRLKLAFLRAPSSKVKIEKGEILPKAPRFELLLKTIRFNLLPAPQKHLQRTQSRRMQGTRAIRERKHHQAFRGTQLPGILCFLFRVRETSAGGLLIQRRPRNSILLAKIGMLHRR